MTVWKKIKQGISLLLTILACFSLISIATSAAAWKTGRVPDRGNSGYTTVHLEKSDRDAQIRIHSYSFLINPNNANEQSTSFYVTLYTSGGQLVWEGEIITGTDGETVTLSCAHTSYRVYIRQNDTPSVAWAMSKANYWGIQCVSNCYI